MFYNQLAEDNRPLKKNMAANAMKKRRRQNALPIPYLQPELQEEILSRLPVKTLTTLKSVCRSWNNLISEPRFSKLHLKQAIHHNRMKLMYLHDCHTTLAYDATSGWLTDADDSDSIGGGASFLAHCHGLFCISIAGDAFLCNPSTKQTRKIATSSINFPTPLSTWASVFFGLGYHSPSDDYKLVRISMFDSVDFRTEVKIYSRNTDTWRRVDDFPYEFPLARPGVFVDGCLHWIVSMWDDDEAHFVRRRDRIALLDLASESYELIRLPEFGRGMLYFDIGSLEEKLVVFYSCNDWTCDIWVLKEHRRPESWTRIKIATDCVSRLEAFFYFQPLCLLKPGQILLRLGAKKIVSFDVAEKRRSEIHTPHELLDSNMVSFVESLVSPYAP